MNRVSYESDYYTTLEANTQKWMDYNIRCENSAESTAGVTKGIENRVGTHSDRASLVVVLGATPFASEYEGQVSS